MGQLPLRQTPITQFMSNPKVRTDKKARFLVEIPAKQAQVIKEEGRKQKRLRKAHAEFILCSYADNAVAGRIH